LEPIGELSLLELKDLLAWVREREGDRPVTVLVGGWAVYYYNKYWGSTDIDLVTNNRTRRSLRYFLLNERGYRTDDETSYSVYKPTDAGDVVIDIAGRGYHNFEGRSEHLDMDSMDERLELANIEGQDVYVPERTFLLIMKLKAAWDRIWRIENGRSADPDHDRSKKIKDFSDILALIDPDEGGKNVDISYLGDLITKNPFLYVVLDDIKVSKEASDKYGVDLRDSREYLVDLEYLIGPRTKMSRS